MAKRKKQRGPKPDKLKINGDWKDALQKAVKKKKPKGGWPKESKNEDMSE